MASREARLRLIVEAVANTSGLSGLFAQLNQIKSSSSNIFGGFDRVSSFSGLQQLTQSLTNARLRMDEVRDAAGNMRRTIEVDVSNATQTATRAFSGFHAEVTKLREQLPKATDDLEQLARKFIFWSTVDAAADSLRRFGERLAQVLFEGMADAADKEAATVGLIEGVLVNNPDLAKQLQEAGEEAFEHFRRGLMDAVNRKAIEVGLSTTYSDNQIAQGMAILAQAGVDVQDILDGVAESMAYIGMIANTDIVSAARGMISIYNMFGDRLDEQFAHIEDQSERTRTAFLHVADVINNAMKASGMTFQELMVALSYAGPAAAQAGQTFADTAATLALFAKNGIQGSKAGTGLRRIITNLTPTTEKAEEAVRRLAATMGGSADVFYDAEGRMKSLRDVQEIMYEMMKDKSPQEQIELLRTIFGQWAISQALILASSEEFGNLTQKINETGTALRYVQGIMGSTQGVTDRAIEATNTLKETLGNFLNDDLNPLKVAYADWIENYLTNTPEHIQETVAHVLGLTSGLAILVGTVGSAVAGFALLKAGLAAAGMTIGGLVASTATIIAAIAAVVAIAYVLYEAWTNNWGGIRDKTMAIVSEVGGFISGYVDNIRTWWNDLGPTTQQAVENIRRWWNWLVEQLNALFGPLTTFVKGVFVDAFVTAWEAIKSATHNAWLVISGIFQTFIALIAGDWEAFFGGLKRIWDGFIGFFQTAWSVAWNTIWSILENLLHAMAERWGWNWDEIKRRFDLFKGAFTTIFQAFWKAIRDIFDVFVKLFQGDWQGAWNKIVEIVNNMKSAVTQAFDRVWQAVGDIFTSWINRAYNWGRNLISSFVDGITSMISNVRSAASSVASAVSNFLGFSSPTKEGPGSTADRWIPNLINMLADDLERYRPVLQSALRNVAGDISYDLQGGITLGTPYVAGSRYNTVNVTINVNGSMSANDIDVLAREVRRQVAIASTY